MLQLAASYVEGEWMKAAAELTNEGRETPLDRTETGEGGARTQAASQLHMNASVRSTPISQIMFSHLQSVLESLKIAASASGKTCLEVK